MTSVTLKTKSAVRFLLQPPPIVTDDASVMKATNAAKTRVRVKAVGSRWILVVDQSPIISTGDRRWLRRFAVTLRQKLAVEV